MGVPYEIAPMSGIQLAGGETKTFPVPFFNRSFINKLVVAQVGAAPRVSFTVELFNSQQALEGAAGSASAAEPDIGLLPLDVFRVGPMMNSTSPGLLLYFSENTTGGRGLMFYSQDPHDANKSSISKRNVYVRITTQGSGAQEFVLALGGEQEIGG